MLKAGTSDYIYYNDTLIDLNMIRYRLHQKANGANIHKLSQTYTKLALVCAELADGFDMSGQTENVKKWLAQLGYHLEPDHAA